MLVLVTADHREAGGLLPSPRIRPRHPEHWVGEPTVAAVRAAGGVPLLLPAGEPNLGALLDRVDAVVITGGAFDIHPAHYGQAPLVPLGRILPQRTATELALARLCVERDIPVLGICGGMQALVVACGGTLVQDIEAQVPGALEHQQPTDPAEGWHTVHLEPGLLQHTLGRAPVVNSTHHQAVADPGPFVVVGRAPDGVVEAVELPNHAFCVGVQWHPELLGVQPYGLLLDMARAR